MSVENATFYSFRLSGKWCATGRGHLSERVFKSFDRSDLLRDLIVEDNSGVYPGLSGRGSGFIFVVVPDDAVVFGYPLLLVPFGAR